MRVLVCEDEPLLVMELEDILAELGHEIAAVVKSGAAALDAARRAAPDVALVDLSLADGYTGPEVVEALAAKGVPVIVVSGQADLLKRPDRAVCRLGKPVDRAALAAALSRVEPGGR